MEEQNQTQSEQTENENEIPVKKAVRIPGWLIFCAAVVVLAAAVYFGIRLMTNPAANMDSVAIALPESGDASSEMVVQSSELNMESPDGEPDEAPATYGVLDGRQDNILTIGTGKIAVAIETGTSPTYSYDGPVIEVVVTHDTIIKKMEIPNDIQSGQTVKATLKDITLNEIPDSAMATVWGEKQGDRIIADFIEFMY